MSWLLFFEWVSSKGKVVQAKHGIVVVAMMTLCVSHFLTHPVLKIATDPKSFEDADAMTLVRDWLLLNKQGENWVNSWYYNHSPLIMEKEMVTAFQPLVIGVVDLDQRYWRNRLLAFLLNVKVLEHKELLLYL